MTLTLEGNTWDSDKHEQSHMSLKHRLSPVTFVLGNSEMGLTTPWSSSLGRTCQREVLSL